ncbi:MAG: glycosyltransferase [Bacteroidales bacterium]|nr:glycosyltransferase [Bacteroidales bacterium]
MNILFDLSATQAENKITNHGGSEYAKAVFVKLIQSCNGNIYVKYESNLKLDPLISDLIKQNSLKIYNKNNDGPLQNYIKNNHINLFYTALTSKEYIPLLKQQSEKFKIIFTIHGLRALELPTDRYEWKYCDSLKSRTKYIYKQLFAVRYKKSLLKYFNNFLKAYRIITVSDYSKYSILSFFPDLEPEKIIVSYSPLIQYTMPITEDIEILENFNLQPKQYLLMISGSIWTKNSLRVITQFDALLSENPHLNDIKMIVTGVKRNAFKVNNHSNFIFSDYLKREILEVLYRNARVFVYPTLNEGFGYPPLEAMKYGTPILASGIGPIPEICKDSAYYLNPYSNADIKIKLLWSINENGIDSESKKQARIEHYQSVKARQERDLNNLISIICNC